MSNNFLSVTTVPAKHGKSFAFETTSVGSKQSRKNLNLIQPETTNLRGLTIRSARICSAYLRLVDPELASHFEREDLMAEICLVRWLRLMLCRECSLAKVLPLWDYLFCQAKPLAKAGKLSLLQSSRMTDLERFERREKEAQQNSFPNLDFYAVGVLVSHRTTLLQSNQFEILQTVNDSSCGLPELIGLAERVKRILCPRFGEGIPKDTCKLI